MFHVKSLYNKILVTIPKKFNDEIVTESGLKLYKDTSYKPEENTITYGTVVASPEQTIAEEEDFKFNVQVGDKLYFHYNVVLDLDNRIEIDGVEMWIVDYWAAIAIVRDEIISPCGIYILIEVPEPKKKLESSLIIIPDTAEEAEETKLKVAYSNIDEVVSGDMIEVDPIGLFKNNIEGKDYYCAFNSNIFLKYD